MSPSPSPERTSSTQQSIAANGKEPCKSSSSTLEASQPLQATSGSYQPAGRRDDLQLDELVDDDDLDGDQDDGYPSLANGDDDDGAPATSLLPPPSFKPLFALVSDPQTNETHHPSIYYVFSDDTENEREGHDVATIAALRALERHSDETAKRHKDQGGGAVGEERFVLLDLESCTEDNGLGLRVKNISSLSPSWAIASTHLRPAPTLEDDPDSVNDELMLTIEGLEITDSSPHAARQKRSNLKTDDPEKAAAEILQDARKRGGGNIVEGMGELWKDLNEGLAVLDRVATSEPESTNT